MSGLLPSTPDIIPDRDPDPRVIGLDSDDADELLAALSSETARSVLAALHDEPSTPSALATEVETSLQNVQYHLGKLEHADLIEEVDTWYSEKGREMSVYAPKDGPLVVYPGSTEDAIGLQQLLTRVIGAVAVLGVASIAIESAIRGWIPGIDIADDERAEPAADTAVDDVMDAEMQADPMVDPEPHWAIEAITAVPPGLLFFLGGCLLLLLITILWFRHQFVPLARSTAD